MRRQFGNFHAFSIAMPDNVIISVLGTALNDLLEPVKKMDGIDLSTLTIIFKHMNCNNTNPLGIYEGPGGEMIKATLGIKFYADIPEEEQDDESKTIVERSK